MQVNITREMRDLAALAEQSMLELYRNSKSYTKLEAERRWYYGYLGELVFLQFCQAFYIRHRYEVDLGPGSDACDFVLFYKGQPVHIDIKTASQPSHQYLMLPTAQLQKHPVEVYVGVRILNQQLGEVIGFCYPKDLQEVTNVGVKVPTMGIPLDKLKPIGQLKDRATKMIQ